MNVLPDFILSGTALRKQKPQYLLFHPVMPLPRDERLIYTPHHPVRWPSRQRPHLLKSSLHVRKQPVFDGLYDIMTEKADILSAHQWILRSLQKERTRYDGSGQGIVCGI